MNLQVKRDRLATMKVVNENEELMIVSEEGVIVRTPVSGIPSLGRSTQGVSVMNVAEDDKVCALAITGHVKRKKLTKDDLELSEDQLGLDDLDEIEE